MDAQQKTRLEQKAVATLLAVFVMILVFGPLRRLGFFRPKSVPTADSLPSAGMAELSKPLTVTLREYARKLTPEVELQARDSDDRTPALAARYTAHGLRDPFKSVLPKESSPAPTAQGQQMKAQGQLTNAPTPLPHLVIEGLWWGSAQPKAIINGQVYSRHDVIGGATITSITREGVTLEFEGQTVQVTMPKGSETTALSAVPRMIKGSRMSPVSQPPQWR